MAAPNEPAACWASVTVLSEQKESDFGRSFFGVCEMVHIRGARALLIMPHRTFPLPDCLGKAVWRTCSLGGFAFLAGPIEPFALRRDVHPSGIECPVPKLTAREGVRL